MQYYQCLLFVMNLVDILAQISYFLGQQRVL